MVGRGTDSSVAKRVVQENVPNGGKASAAPPNLASRQGCEELINETVNTFGTIDALIPSAGLVFYKGIAETTTDEWLTLRSVNIDASFWLCRARGLGCECRITAELC